MSTVPSKGKPDCFCCFKKKIALDMFRDFFLFYFLTPVFGKTVGKTCSLLWDGWKPCGATGYCCSAFFSSIKRKSLHGDALQNDYGGVVGADSGREGTHELVWLSILYVCVCGSALAAAVFRAEPERAFSCGRHMCVILK